MPFKIHMSPTTEAEGLALERSAIARRQYRRDQRELAKATQRREGRHGLGLLALGVFAVTLAGGAVLNHTWGAQASPYAAPRSVVARWVAEEGPELLGDCDTDASCAKLPSCRRDPTCDGGPDTTPRRAIVLVGEGCGPERVTMVAREEDEFGTTCERIDAHYLAPLED